MIACDETAQLKNQSNTISLESIVSSSNIFYSAQSVYQQEADFISIFTMSAPSPTASHTDFCNAMYLVNATPERPSGCDKPIPTTGISDGTLNNIHSTISSIEDDESPDTLKNEAKLLRPSISMGTSLAPNYAYLFMDEPYSTRRSQSDGNFLVIPKFQLSVHKSIKQFGYSFAFDAPTVWNALPEEICASSSLASFRNTSKPTFTPRHTLLSLTYPRHSPWCLDSLLSLDIEIG